MAPVGGGRIVITPPDAAGKEVSVSLNGKLLPGGPFAPTGHIYACGQGGNVTIQEVAGSTGTVLSLGLDTAHDLTERLLSEVIAPPAPKS